MTPPKPITKSKPTVLPPQVNVLPPPPVKGESGANQSPYEASILLAQSCGGKGGCSCGRRGGQGRGGRTGPATMPGGKTKVGWVWIDLVDVVNKEKTKGKKQKGAEYNKVPFHHMGHPQFIGRWRWACDTCHETSNGGGKLKRIKITSGDPDSIEDNPMHQFCSNCHNEQHAKQCTDLKKNKNAPLDVSLECEKCHEKKVLPKKIPGHFMRHLSLSKPKK